MHAAQFRLSESIEEIVKSMKDAIDKKQLEMIINVSKSVPQNLRGDLESIKQVLLNLLSNAVKLTNKGSIEVNIKSKQVKDKYIAAIFSVKGTEIEIPQQEIENLFIPGMQQERTNSKKYEGLKYELEECQKLVKVMGGEIWTTKSLETGIEVNFIINLEVTDEQHLNLLNPTKCKSCKKNLHILMAEDNKVNQMIAGKILEAKGHTYKLATNGREAIELFDQEQFDIILMDIYMPEIDGYVAAKNIRQKDELIPIIALTANTLQGDYEKCFEAGMNYYFTKPIDFDKLFELFNEIFGMDCIEAVHSLNEDIINPEQVFIKLSSDEVFFKRVIRMFEETSKELINDMRLAFLEEDADKLIIAAHTLKGAIGMFEADKVMKIAQDIEMMGRNKRFYDLQNRIIELENAIAVIIAKLDCFIAAYSKA